MFGSNRKINSLLILWSIYKFEDFLSLGGIAGTSIFLRGVPNGRTQSLSHSFLAKMTNRLMAVNIMPLDIA
jgi:hypothetical protein